MHIAVIGASSGVGKQVVEQALEQGHTVRAFARNPDKIEIEHDQLEKIQGDAQQLEAVEGAIEGVDAAICTLGAPPSNKNKPRTHGTRNLVRAMKNQGIKRIICVSSIGVAESRVMLPFFIRYIVMGIMLKSSMDDHATQEIAVRNSDLDWTIVRPGQLTDDPLTGNYKYGFLYSDKTVNLNPIARADVADFILKQLEEDLYVHQAVGIVGYE